MKPVIEVLGKNKATLHGRVVNLRPVTSQSMRAGKFYIRFFNMGGVAATELLKIHGQPFRASDTLRNDDLLGRHYKGKQRVNTVYQNIFSGIFDRDRVCYIGDLGIDSNGYGKTLYEFDNMSLEVLQNIRSTSDCERLLGGYR